MDFDFTKEPGKKQMKECILEEIKPLISIITPFYNAGTYFEQTFYSVINQTFSWFEWIIVNDGSTKKEDVQKLEEIAGRDKRIQIFHTKNSGVSAARNYAAQKACTEIIVPLDADDLIVPIFLETLYWALYFHSDADWCYTDSIGFGDQVYLWNKIFDAQKLKEENFLVNCAAIRKEAFFLIGGYEEKIKYCHEDWLLWLDLLSKSKKPIHLGYYGFWYRRNITGRLHSVENNKDKIEREKANRILKKRVENIDCSIKAIEYPEAFGINQFMAPKCSEFEYRRNSDKDKIKILLLIPWMAMGGADLFYLDIVRRIDKNRFKVIVVTTENNENVWQNKFKEFTADIFPLPTFLGRKNYAEFISYVIKSYQIQIIFNSNSYYGYYLLPWIRKNFKEIAIMDYVHMEEWYWRNGGFGRTSAVLGGVLEKTYVCNERTRNVLIKEFKRNPETVETLYIGVDHEYYNADKVEEGKAKKLLGIEENRKCILFPCRIHPQKRPFLMLEIAKKLSKKESEIAIMVVGDGEELAELKAAVKREQLEETIYFADRQEDMRSFYRDAFVTLICSLKEGLALTAYESCSMGVPVITSDVGGQAELISSQNGIVLPLMQREEEINNRNFSGSEIMQYVEAIQYLLHNPEEYKKKKKQCREDIIKKFSSRIMIKHLENIFNDFISDKRKIEKRQELSEAINKLDFLAEDYCSIYCEFENKEKEAEEIWKAKEWILNQYQNSEKQTKDKEVKLDEIYQMRSWRLIERYQRFVTENRIGKFLRKLFVKDK